MVALISQKNRFRELANEALRKKYPVVTLTCGRSVFVDDNGLLHHRRDSLLSPPPVDEIAMAAQWLQFLTPMRSKTTRTGACSYGMKHACEDFHRSYVSNGSMIVALHRGGWLQSCCRPTFDTLNTCCNLPVRLFDRIAAEERARRRRHWDD